MKTVKVYHMTIDVLYMACVLTKIRKITLKRSVPALPRSSRLPISYVLLMVTADKIPGGRGGGEERESEREREMWS